MAETCAFFNAMLTENGEYDRTYAAQEFAAYFASFIGNGVFPNPSTNLQVFASPGGGMNTIVQAGSAWINGYWYNNSEIVLLNHDPASGTLQRFDAIVVRWSASERDMYVTIKKGVESLSPVRPEPQRDADIYELILAYVNIARNTISINQQMVQDKRLDNAVCGLVHGVVEQLDTTTLGNQLDGFINSYMTKYESDYANFILFMDSMRALSNQQYNIFMGNLATLFATSTEEYNRFMAWLTAYKGTAQTDFETWFETIKDILDENVAGRLQNEIDEINGILKLEYVGEVEHTAGLHPLVFMYSIDYAAGVGGAGDGPAGGSNLTLLMAVDGEFEINSDVSVKVFAPYRFRNCTGVSPLGDNWFAFFEPEESGVQHTSLILRIIPDPQLVSQYDIVGMVNEIAGDIVENAITTIMPDEITAAINAKMPEIISAVLEALEEEPEEPEEPEPDIEP